jgi:ferric-dicitrate binding protein FerR (iron transport regulator)
MSSKPESDDVQSLLQQARVWLDPEPERIARARDAVRAAWLDAHPPRPARWPWFAAAALAGAVMAYGLLGALSEAPYINSPDPARPNVATVRFVTGSVTGRASGATASRPLSSDEVLVAGTLIETDRSGRGSVALLDGVELRLDEETSLHMDDEHRLTLARGAVYVDTTTRRGPATPILILARGAEVRDVGTRFEVRLFDESLRVQVRDGLVRVAHGRETHEAAAGTALTMTARNVRTTPVPAFGMPWEWTVRAAAPPQFDGRTLAEFLTWVTRESGRAVRFADPVLERSASLAIIHGSVDGFSVDDALDIVLPSCGLMHRIDADTIVILAAEAGSAP